MKATPDGVSTPARRPRTPPAPGKLVANRDVPAYLGLPRAAWNRAKAMRATPPPVHLPGSAYPYYLRADLDRWAESLPKGD